MILVDSTDPIGPGEGLFSPKFYQDCFRILSDEGILINQHESPFFDQYKNNFDQVKSFLINNNFEIIKSFYFPTFHYKDVLFKKKGQ